MSIRDAYYFALLEVHNGRPISVKTCFKGQQGDLTTLSRTVCRCQTVSYTHLTLPTTELV